MKVFTPGTPDPFAAFEALCAAKIAEARSKPPRQDDKEARNYAAHQRQREIAVKMMRDATDRPLEDEAMQWPDVMTSMRLDKMPDSRGWLLYGAPGNGKSARAKLAAKFADIKIVDATQLTRDFVEMPFHQAAWLGHKTRQRQMDRDLVIDDIGSEPTPVYKEGTAHNVLSEVICARYELFPSIRTYLTTNLTLEGIRRLYGERVMSRLHQMCVFISNPLPDWRSRDDCALPIQVQSL